MSLLSTLGAKMGKLLMREDLLTGILKGMDPKAMGRVVNANAGLIGELIGSIDPAVIAGVINQNPDLLGKLISSLDPKALSQAVGKNPQFIMGLVDGLDPNIFSSMAGMLFAKMRKAGPRPSSRDNAEQEAKIA